MDAGVKDRVHRPFLFLRDKLVESSRLLGVLAAKFRFANSARFPPDDVDMRLVERAAEHYVRSRVYTEVMCGLSASSAFTSSSRPRLSRTIPRHLRFTPTASTSLPFGTIGKSTRQAGDRVLDASRLFEREDRVYVDGVHFNKRRSRLLGEHIRTALEALPSPESNSNR